ncbi:HSP20 family protein [Sulfobacillus thermosulfidooxidans DSM 9293]|uniref:HSP20 family protein n=1 Tax=Sulfobacillus thermosulfidooxidans (strain DSM 9293 / VKM B-1269 / AT-1) TaxID=929705 RepID=A0A1W1WGX2_SULTA|nr:Hsp20/alpha crystallin family protein [Sulfobacillus thermosulfidooxidans]SMC04983.1 HSP20 family protein [Sulfobacillus thermosulfidooxidans DSM 9293]
MSLFPIRRTQQTIDVRDPFIRLQNDMNQLFDSLTRTFNWGFHDGMTYDTLLTPAADLVEDDANYYVRFDVPGVDAKDMSVSLEDHTLILSGEKQEEHRVNRARMYGTERIYGKFYREIPLPQDADTEHMRASLKHGVLTVTVPKTAIRTSKSIPIENE